MPSTPPVVSGLSIYRGDDWALPVRFWSDAAKTTPLDVSGRTFTAQFRLNRNNVDKTDVVIDTADAATGVIVLHLTAATTAAMPIRMQYLDLQQVEASVTTTIFQASVPVSADVTRAA